MIIVTGGAGFIGSALVWQLNRQGYDDILVVDNLGHGEKWKNLRALSFKDYLEKDAFLTLVSNNKIRQKIDAILHMGACSSTTEYDASYLIRNNFEYSKILAQYCRQYDIRFIYASSAATYGLGQQGYLDNVDDIQKLRPLNIYGYSKQLFDLWAKGNSLLSEKGGIVGLKFFNVFGPNEAHKDDMRSVVHKSYGQILEHNRVSLFKSYLPEYAHGEQQRDFIYIKDAVNMALFFLEKKNLGGLFNIGTGKARPWKDLVSAVFMALGKQPRIDYIDMPNNLKSKYQYFTQANIARIKQNGYQQKLFSLEDAIKDYIQNYLVKEHYLGDEKKN